jgi:hypothetical protein
LQAEDGQVVLTVRDDGDGPPMDGRLEEVSKGFGARLMRYRADLIGGSFRLGPADGGGRWFGARSRPRGGWEATRRVDRLPHQAARSRPVGRAFSPPANRAPITQPEGAR